MSEACVHITEYTDPSCPWAYSAEPFRHRISWLYEGHVTWQPRMVLLADTAADQVAKGRDPRWLAKQHTRISHEHRMPIDTRERDHVPGTGDACRAVVGARVHADHPTMRHLLRQLRVRYFSGEMLDDPEMIRAAAADAGIGAEIEAWMADPEVERELQADRAGAREPIPAARILDHKLANWSGGRRYSCPSYEMTRLSDGVTIAVPGFQPFAVYDTVLANLCPGLERREPPQSVLEVLEWRGFPLATQEVATVCDIGFDEAHEELGRVAEQSYVGADGFWEPTGS
ncbi:MAG: DsbA family protein [Solirubrobacterales bacterium]|nr:DsbA family protein [Solirubrobacterales bacterium]